MKALLLGGTGTISMDVTRQLVKDGWDVTVMNRGHRKEELPAGVTYLEADLRVEEEVEEKLSGKSFDSVCDFVCFTAAQAKRDIRLFSGRCGQFVFVSSASAYQKPCEHLPITEETPLANPFWEYSRNKIECEELLWKEYRENGFPVTVIRPSHTYDNRKVPVGVHGNNGSYQVLCRMKAGKPVLIHGDGTTLWTVTHSRDVAKGFAGLMGNPLAIGEAVQVTGDEYFTWNRIYEMIAEEMGVKLHAFHVSSELLAAVSRYNYNGALLGDKANNMVFDNAKLKRLVPGFEATIRFREGVRESLAYIEAHPEQQIEDPIFDVWCDRVAEMNAYAQRSMKAHLDEFL